MSTATQLNWHSRYLSTVAELYQARLENDRLQAQLDKLIGDRAGPLAKVIIERDMLASRNAQIELGLKSLLEALS